MTLDLNELKIDGNENAISSNGIYPYFKNLDSVVLEHIEKADAVFGCACWFTNPTIMRLLETKSTLMVINKDIKDKLDPNVKYTNSSYYSGFYFDWNKFDLPDIIGEIEFYAPPIESIRCAGQCLPGSDNYLPKQHNKFMVFCKAEHNNIPIKYDPNFNTKLYRLVPYGVMTGSYNYTKIAMCNFENIVYLHNQKIANAYLGEFLNIFRLSESIPWKNNDPTPDLIFPPLNRKAWELRKNAPKPEPKKYKKAKTEPEKVIIDLSDLKTAT